MYSVGTQVIFEHQKKRISYTNVGHTAQCGGFRYGIIVEVLPPKVVGFTNPITLPEQYYRIVEATEGNSYTEEHDRFFRAAIEADTFPDCIATHVNRVLAKYGIAERPYRNRVYSDEITSTAPVGEGADVATG
jgi:hypothetical protein